MLDMVLTTIDPTLQRVSWVHLALMSPSGVTPSVRLVAHAASVRFPAPMAMFLDQMSPHVTFGELACVLLVTVEALDWTVYFFRPGCSIFPCLENMEVIERAWRLAFGAGVCWSLTLQTGIGFVDSLV